MAVGTAREDLKMSTSPGIPARSAVLRVGEPEKPRDKTDMSAMHARTQSNENSTRTPENVSMTPDLPARGAEPHMGKPERLESQTDASDTCTCMQDIANVLRRSVSMSECVRTPQNSWTKSDSPGTSQDRTGIHADASDTRTHVHNDRIDAETAAKTQKISVQPHTSKNRLTHLMV